jgi:long-chain acyl-CoA synthetase
METSNRWWLQHYPAGVEHEVDLARYSSLLEMADEAFAKFGDRAMYTCLDKTLTFHQVDELSRAFAAWLQSLGLKQGARVALMMPNLLQYPVAILGVLRAGCVVVNVNPLYTPRELEHQLKDSGSEAIVILENFATTLQSVIGATPIKHVVIASVGDLLGFPKGLITNFVVRKVKKVVPQFHLPGHVSFNDVIAKGRSLTLKSPTVGAQDIAFLQYTGGTTGVSKGAVLVHENIFGNCLVSEAWLHPAIVDTSKGPAPDPMVIVCALPMYHIFSLVTCMWLAIKMGGHNILIPNPRDLDGMVKTLSKHRFNILPAVNTMFNGLVNHAGFRELDFSGLRVSNGGGMAVQRAVAEKWLNLTRTPIVSTTYN